MKLSVLVGALLLFSSSAGANETDPWYAWVHPPRDGGPSLDRAIGDRFARGLRAVNGRRDPGALQCRDVAATMTTPVRTAAFFFFAGDLGSWGVDYSPRSASEYFDSLSANGAYRHIYWLMPLDPSMRAGDVLFGTDKLGHFFTNGLRQYDRYRDARATGASEDEAVLAAIREGIAEEKAWLGLYASGIFSYADLEANHQGFMFFRALCEDGELALVDGAWSLTKPFRIARWVSPRWDEAFSSSYFQRSPDEAKRGLAELCDELDSDAARERRARYRAQERTSASSRVVSELIARGELPDPTPWSYERVCSPPRGAVVKDTPSAADRGVLPRLPSRHAFDGARTPGR